MDARAAVESFAEGFNQLDENIRLFIRGNREVVRLALVCLFAEGHLLVEGVPGVAKTSLARAIAAGVAGLDHKRIQFTPDLLPADVTGSRVFRQRSDDFDFEPGPVFTNILLADEINRASPRTQSALLEVMAEKHVTADGVRRAVPAPFFCVATQNPIELRGTYPLPEAQIDRFMMKLTMAPPGESAELEVIAAGLKRLTPETVVDSAKRLTAGRLEQMLGQVRAVECAAEVRQYVCDLVRATRADTGAVRLGVSTRGAVALALAAQAHAASRGEEPAVLPDDVKYVAKAVLCHRLVLTSAALARGDTPQRVVERVLEDVPVPDYGKAVARV